LHTALVYFGLRHDSSLADRFDAEPITAWRYAAVITIAVVGLAMALGVLTLLGVHALGRRFAEAAVVLVVVPPVVLLVGRWYRA
jgi:high-affinity Fe2+/Pb2+ permease